MPTISQKTDVPGQSCGACAASYVVYELLQRSFTKEQVEGLWKKVQFGTSPKPGLIEAEHSDPSKLIRALEADFPSLKLTGCLAQNSPLAGLTSALADRSVVHTCDPMQGLLANPNWRAIGIYMTDGLHYVATKYEDGLFHLKDSNAAIPTYVAGPALMTMNVPFLVALEGATETYAYLGAGILVHL